MKPFLKSNRSPASHCVATMKQNRKSKEARKFAALPRKTRLRRLFGI